MTIKSKVSNDKYREEWERIFGRFKERHPDKEDRSTFEYPPIENPEYDKPDTYKEDQHH